MRPRFRHVASLALLLLWGLGARPGFSVSWYIDPAGDDSAAGTAAAPWRSWGKLVHALNASQIRPGDIVRFRPGRYSSCDALSWPLEPLTGPGGTASQPITVTVDTTVPGNVEIHGSAKAGECGVTAWTQARKCATGAFAGAACDTNTECAGSTCADMPGVYWTYSTTDNNSSFWGGLAGGVAFQPAKAAGGAPKIYEILYSPTSDSHPIVMPKFTPGYDQSFPYATMESGNCVGARNPWLCCTGAGTGTCTKSRMYVQTASGVRPDLAVNATFDEVEVPASPRLLNQGGSTPTRYINFTNNNNGRTFFFWWTITNVFVLQNIENVVFADFDIGYQSRVASVVHKQTTGSPNSSGFPRFAGGETHLVYTWWNTNGTNVVRNLTFRRGKVHGNQGNEMIHGLPGDPTRFGNITWDTVEFGDGPFAPVNGTSGTALTPNANNSQLQKSWPPPGYEAWAARYPTHWGPLGGGGNSDGAFIVNSYKTTVRNSYFHDTGLISFFEGGTGSGLIFENNVLDLARMAYTDSGLQPNVLVSYCGSPTSCGGLEGRLALSIAARHSRGPEEGSIVRNNVFKNVYANALRVGWFENAPGEMNAAVAPATPNMIVNNTFHIKGDYLYANAGYPPPVIWIDKDWGSAAVKGIFKNNIFLRDTPSTHSLPMFQILDVAASHTDMDYNNWGGQNVIWKVEDTAYTTFPSFQSRMQTYAAGNESHSLYTSPQFVTPYTDLRLQLTSPSYLTGTDLSSTGWAPFNYDFNRVRRPAGSWSMGAYQDLTGDDRHRDH